MSSGKSLIRIYSLKWVGRGEFHWDSLVYFKVRWTVITNCDSFFITKCDTVYYKLRQVLQSAINLLKIATGITKCDSTSWHSRLINLNTDLQPGKGCKILLG